MCFKKREMVQLLLAGRGALYRCSAVQVFDVNCGCHPASKGSCGERS